MSRRWPAVTAILALGPAALAVAGSDPTLVDVRILPLADGDVRVAPGDGAVSTAAAAPRSARSPRPGVDRGAALAGRGIALALAFGEVVHWTNFGGNAQRNGRSGGAGPITDELLWSNTTDFSIISWHPVISDGRVYAIRQSGFPATAANDALVALDLETGAELWRVVVPYGGNPDTEWIAYVGGARDGRVYAARGGSGRETPVYAFDGATGALVWTSSQVTAAGPQDGIVFTSEGDLIVGDFVRLTRLRGTDGATLWSVSRFCAISGNCGAALGPDGVFVDEPSPDAGFAQSIAKYDLATGAFLYRTGPMSGGTVQNAPFLSLDGSTVYLARTQNNVLNDFLFAFEDTGSSLDLLWDRPIRWTTSHEHGLAADGSIYTFLQNDEFVRLDPATGEVTASAGVLSPLDFSTAPRTAVGVDGTVYVSNGWASNPVLNGRVWAFDADLTTNLFTLVLNRQNSGGPSLGAGDTLVVADRVGVYAYRTPAQPCPADLNGDGVVDGADLGLLLNQWGACAG